MKLSKFAALVKRKGRCRVIRQGDHTWLSLGCAIYKADGMPEIHGSTQAQTVLDLPDKAWKKIFYDEDTAESAGDICGIDMTENVREERQTEAHPMQLCYKKGIITTALRCDDGELVFYDASLIGPVADIVRDSDYAQIVARKNSAGITMIVVKNGFEPIAAIAPIKMLNKDFVADLADLDSLCVEQYEKAKFKIGNNGDDDEEN